MPAGRRKSGVTCGQVKSLRMRQPLHCLITVIRQSEYSPEDYPDWSGNPFGTERLQGANQGWQRDLCGRPPPGPVAGNDADPTHGSSSTAAKTRKHQALDKDVGGTRPRVRAFIAERISTGEKRRRRSFHFSPFQLAHQQAHTFIEIARS